MKDKNQNQISRRNFFRNAGMGTAAVAGLPLLASSCTGAASYRKIADNFSQGDVILLQGDSITDAGREKKKEHSNNGRSFGGGYAFLLASWLLEELAQKELTIYNRGISGNKVYQLNERWAIGGFYEQTFNGFDIEALGITGTYKPRYHSPHTGINTHDPQPCHH